MTRRTTIGEQIYDPEPTSTLLKECSPCTATIGALRTLRDSGAALEKREDSFGVTRSGWWLDGVYLGKDAKTAAASITG